jgi:hypothetical protein
MTAPRHIDATLSQLSPSLLDEATRDVRSFTTFLVAGNKLCGSGTFATLQGYHGILTAKHVWELVEKLSCVDGKVGYSISDDPHAHIVARDTLIPMKLVSRQSEEYGPDIEFVVIPPDQVGSVLARRQFYSLSKTPEQRMANVLGRETFAVIAGFPYELDREHPGAYGFDKIIEQHGLGFLTGADKREERDGFDYLELGVTYNEETNPPQSFGGVSGAGVWHFQLFKEGDKPISEARYDPSQFLLMGVAFYQSPITAGQRFIRAHGQNTIYKFLNQKAAAWCAPQP